MKIKGVVGYKGWGDSKILTLRQEGGKHKIFSFDVYERAPEDEQVEKNRM